MNTTIYSKEEIVSELQKAVMASANHISAQDDSVFHTSVEGKWSTAQQLDHLRKSSKPLAIALDQPKIFLRFIVGKPNRPSRTCIEVITKYERIISYSKNIT